MAAGLATGYAYEPTAAARRAESPPRGAGGERGGGGGPLRPLPRIRMLKSTLPRAHGKLLDRTATTGRTWTSASVVRRSQIGLDALGVSAAKTRLTAIKLLRESAPRASKLPVILFSHRLGELNCIALSDGNWPSGATVVVMEHEGGNASYCVTEAGEQITYNRPWNSAKRKRRVTRRCSA